MVGIYYSCAQFLGHAFIFITDRSASHRSGFLPAEKTSVSLGHPLKQQTIQRGGGTVVYPEGILRHAGTINVVIPFTEQSPPPHTSKPMSRTA
jgi:hypothetical protein